MPTRKAAHGAKPPRDSPDADDHHRPSTGLRYATRSKTGNIAEEARSIGHLGLVTAIFRSCEIGKARQRPVIVEHKWFAAKAVAPRIVDPHPVGIGLEHRRDELTRHLQDRRIVIAARCEGLIPYAGPPGRLDRRCNGGGGTPLAIEGEQASLVARKNGDQQTGDQQQEQYRILLAALRAYPVSRRNGGSHAVPHPPSEELLFP